MCLLGLSIINSGCKKDAVVAAVNEGAGLGPALTKYITSCTTTSGPTYGANSYKIDLSTTGSSTYSLAYFYYSGSGCTGQVYAMTIGGTYVRGTAVNSPSGSYLITFTPTSSSVTAYDSTTAGLLNTGCGSHWSTGGGTTTYISTTPGLICGALGIAAANTPIYNNYIVNGSTLSMGSFTNNNPGATSMGSIPTTSSVNLSHY